MLRGNMLARSVVDKLDEFGYTDIVFEQNKSIAITSDSYLPHECKVYL